MKILVANLGSTSFKYRLFDMAGEQQLARGGVERIGSQQSPCFVEIAGNRTEITAHIPDHGVAMQQCLEQLTHSSQGCLQSADEVSAIGFKAVHGGRISGVQRVSDDVLAAMEEMSQIAPAHNPPYIAAMRQLAERFPDIPLVAAFETGFHQTIDDALRYYGVPFEWADQLHIQRWGFHGASHRYIAGRIAELSEGSLPRVISLHLGGSSSLCAIKDGKSVATSMGMSPQTGLPHNNRCGDFDPFAIPLVMKKYGKTLDEVLDQLANQSGLLGLSGVSGDMRDLDKAASQGNVRAELALKMFTAEIRRHMGGLMVAMGGVDALVFTGGIGENDAKLRAGVCRDLKDFGIELDSQRNSQPAGECQLQAGSSRVAIWVVPTNEEIVVARQAKQILDGAM